MDRRRFLTVLGATSGGAAALSAAGIGPEPTEHLVPYIVPPEEQIPGTATYYATTCREYAAVCGLHAKVREGRVIKLEGNPESPINEGRLCSRGQAALQGLYNPRSEEHTSELQSPCNLVCRLLLEKKKNYLLVLVCT